MRLNSARVRSKFGAPTFEPEVVRKQMHCFKEGTLCTAFLYCKKYIVGTFVLNVGYCIEESAFLTLMGLLAPPAFFQRPSDLAPRELCPPCTLVTLLNTSLRQWKQRSVALNH